MEMVFMEQPVRLRNKLFVLVLFIIAQSCNSTSPTLSYDTDNVKLETKNGIVFKDGKTFTGHLYTLTDSTHDSLFSAFYKAGKQDGAVVKWYPDGKLMERRSYEENVKIGIHSGFWQNGNKKFLYHFVNGNYEGIQQRWFESGKLYQEKTYKKGQEEGLQREWDNMGSLMINYEAHNGRQYGNIGKKHCASVWREDVYAKPAK
jgi:antitoxin component YwqK of YwqJK toxin-antitoxin module